MCIKFIKKTNSFSKETYEVIVISKKKTIKIFEKECLSDKIFIITKAGFKFMYNLLSKTKLLLRQVFGIRQNNKKIIFLKFRAVAFLSFMCFYLQLNSVSC